jgi:hypothetical protein
MSNGVLAFGTIGAGVDGAPLTSVYGVHVVWHEHH